MNIEFHNMKKNCKKLVLKTLVDIRIKSRQSKTQHSFKWSPLPETGSDIVYSKTAPSD